MNCSTREANRQSWQDKQTSARRQLELQHPPKTDKAARQKVSKDIKELAADQQGLIGIYAHSSQNMLQALFSSIPDTNMKVDHTLSNRTSLNKFKRLAI